MMMRIIILLCCCLVVSCARKETPKSIYNDLGDISFDSKLDNKDFKVCHEDISMQFNWANGLDIQGGKYFLREYFKKYSHPIVKGESGIIVIRFIVNCEGKTGRFRVYEMDKDLKANKFQHTIRDNILDLTKLIDT